MIKVKQTMRTVSASFNDLPMKQRGDTSLYMAYAEIKELERQIERLKKVRDLEVKHIKKRIKIIKDHQDIES